MLCRILLFSIPSTIGHILDTIDFIEYTLCTICYKSYILYTTNKRELLAGEPWAVRLLGLRPWFAGHIAEAP